MSKVYSFRLSEDNPREAQAREVIEAWVKEGYSLRHMITEALVIAFKNRNDDEEVITILSQIKRMISEIENPVILDNNEHMIKELSESFMISLKNSTKTGLRLE